MLLFRRVALLSIIFLCLEELHAAVRLTSPLLSAKFKSNPRPSAPSLPPSSRSSMEADLWIVGCGKLGMLVAKRWLEIYPSALVVGETNTVLNHDEISALGAVPRLRRDRHQGDIRHAKHILISIPPYSRSPETSKIYIPEVLAATKLPNTLLQSASSSKVFRHEINDDDQCQTKSKILLISSTSIYGDPVLAKSHKVVNEFSPLAAEGEKGFASASRSIEAENIVKMYGQGSVLRLAGLYDKFRGPHMYWLSAISKLGTPGGDNALNLVPDKLINLIHYEDAASAAVRALVIGTSDATYLACDGNPISRQEIIKSAAAAGVMPGLVLPAESKIYTKSEGSCSKICDANWTCNELQWLPKYERFDLYMQELLCSPL